MSTLLRNAVHMGGMKEKDEGLPALIGTALRLREIDSQYRSAVSAGVDAYQEHRAYGFVLPHVNDPRQNTAHLRAAGLVASFPGIAQTSKPTPFGRSLAQLTKKRSGSWPNPSEMDAVAKRVLVLPEQDLEEAANTVRRLLALADGTGVAFDFFAIAKLFTRWGSGFTESSLAVRQSTVSAYWQGNNSAAESSEPEKD